MCALFEIKCWYYSKINRRFLYNTLSSKISLLQDLFQAHMSLIDFQKYLDFPVRNAVVLL